jgi:hypothetical protein
MIALGWAAHTRNAANWLPQPALSAIICAELQLDSHPDKVIGCPHGSVRSSMQTPGQFGG